jgi:hypothetical protein
MPIRFTKTARKVWKHSTRNTFHQNFSQKTTWWKCLTKAEMVFSIVKFIRENMSNNAKIPSQQLGRALKLLSTYIWVSWQSKGNYEKCKKKLPMLTRQLIKLFVYQTKQKTNAFFPFRVPHKSFGVVKYLSYLIWKLSWGQPGRLLTK